MATRMQQRRATATQWETANPVLAPGEIGWESNTNKFKIGDGVNTWDDLPYFLDEDTLAGSIDDYIPLTQKGVADGVATLDANGKVPSTQIPNIDELAQDAVDSALTAGTGITKTYNDNANTITVAVDTSTIAPLAGPTFTGTVTLPSTTSIGDVSATEIGYVNGVTSGIQTQLDNKAASSHTHSPSDITGLTASAAELNILDGATLSTTELNYVDGVTSAIQTQLDGKAASSHTHAQSDITNLTTDLAAKAPLANPTFTGTVVLPSTTSIGDVSATELGYLNNVTSAIQTQLDGKAASSHSHAIADITNLQTSLDGKLNLSGGTMTGAITLSGAPTEALHAASKAYVDAISEGLHIHPSVVAATAANVNISTDLEPGDVVDGVTLAEGNRVLVKSQTNAAQNGIYVVQASGAALRAADFNEPAEVDGGDFVFVVGGTLYDNTGWAQTTTNVVTVGTDPIEFTQFSGAGTYQAGTGLTLTGNVFAADTTVVAPLAGPTFTGTVVLPSTTSIGDVSSTELGYLNNVTSAIQTQLDGKAASSHTHAQSDITNLTTDLAAKANLAGPTFTGTVTLPSTTSIGNVSSTELGYLDGVTSAIQTQLNNKAASSHTHAQSDITNLTTDLAAKAPLAGPTFTGTVVLPSTTSIGNVSSTELGYLDGVTSAIQTQLNGKSATGHTHTLDELSDVTITSAANNQVLKFNGTAWVNAAGGEFTSQTVSSNITLAASNKYFVDTSVARTLTLPASPSLGDEIQVFDASGTAGTNNISVSNNSNKINGQLDSALLDVNGVAAVFVWTGSTYGWRMG
jgi:hypothetical protein